MNKSQIAIKIAARLIELQIEFNYRPSMLECDSWIDIETEEFGNICVDDEFVRFEDLREKFELNDNETFELVFSKFEQ